MFHLPVFSRTGKNVLPSGTGIAEPIPVPLTPPKAPIREILRAPKTPAPAKPGAAIYRVLVCRLSIPKCSLSPSGTSGTLYLFSGISYEKNVQEKDPGKCWQCAGRSMHVPVPSCTGNCQTAGYHRSRLQSPRSWTGRIRQGNFLTIPVRKKQKKSSQGNRTTTLFSTSRFSWGTGVKNVTKLPNSDHTWSLE